MKYLEIPNRQEILKELREENKKHIVIIELQIRMGKAMLEKQKIKDDKIKEEDREKDFGTEAVAVKMKLEAFEKQRVELYDGLNFINDEIIEASKNKKE